MIWHLYNNNEKYIMTDAPTEILKTTYNPTSSFTDEDSSSCEENDSFALKKSYVAPDSKSLFLNFAPDLNIKTTKAKKSPKQKTASVKVNGVNILNRKNLDSKTIADRIQKRKENHNILERRRRDCINNTILEISRVLPDSSLPEGQNSNKYSILKSALAYIMSLQTENELIKQNLPGGRYSVKNELPSLQNHPTLYEPRITLNNDFQINSIL